MSKMNLNNMLRVTKEKRVNSLQVKNCAGVVGNSSLLAPQVKNKPYKKQVKSALAASVLQEGGVNPSAVAKNMAALAQSNSKAQERAKLEDHVPNIVAEAKAISADNANGINSVASDASAAGKTGEAGAAREAMPVSCSVRAQDNKIVEVANNNVSLNSMQSANQDAAAKAAGTTVAAVETGASVATSTTDSKDDLEAATSSEVGLKQDGSVESMVEASFDANNINSEVKLRSLKDNKSMAKVATKTALDVATKAASKAASKAGSAASKAASTAVKVAQSAAQSAPVKKLAQRTFFAQIVHTLSLFLPLFMGQLAATSMGVVDTVMAGAAGTLELSGVAIGSSIFWPSELFVVGMALAIHPLIANLVGNGQLYKVALRMQVATVCTLACAAIIGVIIMLVPLVYRMFPSVDQDMVNIGQGYLIAVGLAMPGFAMFNVLRAYWEGLGKTGPTLMFGCMALVLNIPLNYIFIFGHLGMTALGGVGCGVATALSIYFTVIGMLFYVKKSPAFAKVRIYQKWEPMSWSQCWSFLKLSLPLGIAGMIETLCFSLVAIMLSPFGPVVVASHTIAMNVSGLLAIVPIALSSTASIEVGEAMGTNSWSHARKRALSSTSLAVAFYVIGASVLFFMGEQIAALYSDDADVLLLAPVLMMYCVVFFFPETLQVMAIGILRGLKDSRTIFLVTIVAYWIVGMPIGYSLGYGYLGDALEGAEGFWLGFIFSLTCASVLLGGRLLYLFIKEKNPDTTARSF
ncbi:MATE family efflux transporter [Anaerobiospirillum sp. NML120448]|uniref:MATE family efflux transporter n=1 Tax=Anaerobiospirillum sp. NML120448 TaxID=2932816 RepID=UPI001FF237DA|nr:MATE family efflux transporter [Anaerobiospirillum sp. NML120448]MCK0515369.1 MATE family efflux transporter [Anaerobiospirillum sp. NML120448]